MEQLSGERSVALANLLLPPTLGSESENIPVLPRTWKRQDYLHVPEIYIGFGWR
jgi:hypothetical protein